MWVISTCEKQYSWFYGGELREAEYAWKRGSGIRYQDLVQEKHVEGAAQSPQLVCHSVCSDSWRAKVQEKAWQDCSH